MKSLEDKSNVFITEMLDEASIDLPVKKYLTHDNTHPLKIYGLPKLYKINFPSRPIVSCAQSSQNYLSKFLAGILNNVSLKDGMTLNLTLL